MLQNEIIKDLNFQEVAEVKLDLKNRVTLGKARSPMKTKMYKVYRNSLGQIILDPQVTIPAHEQWLFKNKQAARQVKSGLQDAKKMRLVKVREDFSKHV